MLDRLRNLIGLDGGENRRRLTRTEREFRQRRLLYMLTIVAAVVVALVLIGGAVYQYILVPRQVYATVNGEDIHRTDYEKRRKYDIMQDMARLSQQIQTTTETTQRTTMQQQFETLQTELAELNDGDKVIDPDTLKTMVEDELVLQSLDDFGIDITDEDLDLFIDQMLVPVPLTDPSPTATVPATAAAWATQTTTAFIEQSTATSIAQSTAAEETAVAGGTATAEAPTVTPGGPTATPAPPTSTPAPTATPSPTATATLEPGAPTPTVDPDAPTPFPTPAPTATVDRGVAMQTAEAGFELLDRNFLEAADMNRDEFEELVAMPLLARQKVSEALSSDIQTTQEQIQASHILVATEEAAQELIDGRLQDEDFATVAEEVSTDTGTAQNGGDLGWFPRGVMTKPFEEAAFALDVGEMTQEPVQSEFGWHIIKVTDHADDRPLTLSMINSLKANAFTRWLEDEYDAADISAEVTLPVDEQPVIGGTLQ